MRLKPTVALSESKYVPPQSVEALYSAGPSPAGWSATSRMLECPEKDRLTRLGVTARPPDGVSTGIGLLDALGMGLLMHAALATRIHWGQEGAEYLLANFEGLHPDDKLRAVTYLRIYDMTYPLHADPWQYLGVEAEVITDIGFRSRTGKIKKLLRTVRYDAIVRPFRRVEGPEAPVYTPGTIEDGVLSLEHKTSSRGGQSAMNSYRGQFATQVALWNANPALVEKYGRMVGVIPDMIVKTVVPSCDRVGPIYIDKLQQERALDYLRLTESIKYPIAADGSAPRMLHACWGRWGVCEFVDLCHNGMAGNYDWPALELQKGPVNDGNESRQ